MTWRKQSQKNNEDYEKRRIQQEVSFVKDTLGITMPGGLGFWKGGGSWPIRGGGDKSFFPTSEKRAKIVNRGYNICVDFWKGGSQGGGRR